MQRYFIENKFFNENRVMILGKDFHHIKNVMRFDIGDEIIAVDYQKNVFLTRITEIRKKAVIAKLVEQITAIDKTMNLSIAQSLIKKDNMELVLQKTTELGVREIIPFRAKRSIVKIDDFRKKKIRYETIVKEASEQSERCTLPIISDIHEIESVPYSDFDLVLVAYARNNLESKLSDVLKSVDVNTKILVLIGPEGGFSAEELEYLADKGTFISLGSTILRSETAAIYIASSLRYILEN
ncbi:MAG: 16S rRNA (uracil(1498)-N(3))-methyltransferase, partial [Tenericutes bacterium]|nr:16S rRNA (uracil(1498)-N(3))-methyltransferase [Mycoplasmatota bacterium]